MPGQPHYSLKVIKDMLTNDCYLITGQAPSTAQKDFGWTEKDIKKALLLLKKKHFHKSAKHLDDPAIYVDYYKARGLMNENVYTHFHIEDGWLVINSCKEI